MMKHNLIETGRPFQVVEPTEDSTFGVGTTGFFSYVDKNDSSFINLAMVRTVIIRRGKGGKERMDIARMYFPIFPIEAKEFQKAMPDKGVRKAYVHIEPGEKIGDAMMLPDIEYLGWATASVRRLKHMAEKCKHHQWPGSSKHIMNQFMRIHEYFEDDPSRIKERMASQEKRVELLDVLRSMASSMTRMVLHQSVYRADLLLSAAEFLEFTNSGGFIPKDAKDKKNEYRFTEDDKSLQLLVKKHQKLHKHLSGLSKAKANKS